MSFVSVRLSCMRTGLSIAVCGLVWCVLLVFGTPVAAQQADTLRTISETVESVTDTLEAEPAGQDTLQRAEQERPADQTRPQDAGRGPAGDEPASDGEAMGGVVDFSARDSLVISFDAEEGDTASFFGEAEATHRDARLEAHRIDVLLDRDEMHASGPPDNPDDPTAPGRPHFQQEGGDSFTGSQLAFNMRTERGRVVGARTEIDQDGFVTGQTVKLMEDNTLFVADGVYTTCGCDPTLTPSYSFRGSRMMMQDEWVFTGPIQMYLFNIPTPLVLPFGILPALEGRRSGLLPANFGEDERGFYIRDWGWYFSMNDYTDLQLQGGVWSRGSWEARALFRYNRRYHYRGNLRLNFTRNQRGERQDPDFTRNDQWRIQWNHNQELSPTAQISGDVDFVSSSRFRRIESDDFDELVSQETSSSVRYQKRWRERGQRLSVSMNQRQSFEDGSARLRFPNLSFNQSSFRPFQREQRGPGEDEGWFERIQLSYSGDLSNRYNFDPLSEDELEARGDPAAADINWYDGLLSPSKYERATGDDERFNFEASHRIPIRANFTLNQLPFTSQPANINLSPRINYSEEWRIRTERLEFRDSTETETGRSEVVSASEPGFFSRREFDTSLSANTTFYGTFPVELGPFRGLRHTVRPSLSFNYRPNYNTDFWGYTRTYFDESEGEEVRYDIMTGRTARGSTEQRTLSFSLRNEFETRQVQIEESDEEGEPPEESTRTLRLLNVDLDSGYNFAADSLNFNDIRLSARTNILDQFSVRFRSTFSPYAETEDGRTIDRFVFQQSGFALARLTNLNLTVSTSFEGGRREDRAQQAQAPAQGRFDDMQVDGRPGGDPMTEWFRDGRHRGPGQFADFSIPWSLSLDFNYRLRRRNAELSPSATVDAQFDFNLTPDNMKVRGRTGFDFVEGDISTTQLDIVRQVGCCWQMSLNWTPFGEFQSYGFSLRVTSGMMSDLLQLNIPRDERSGRFDGLTQGRF